MKLEHRWSQRISMDLNAIVFHRPLGLVRAKIMDVSREGVLIDTGRISLTPCSIVELTFTLDMDGKPKLHQAEALVVHLRLGRLGLMFKDFSLDMTQTFRSMLSAALLAFLHAVSYQPRDAGLIFGGKRVKKVPHLGETL